MSTNLVLSIFVPATNNREAIIANIEETDKTFNLVIGNETIDCGSIGGALFELNEKVINGTIINEWRKGRVAK